MALSFDIRYLWIDSLCIIQDDKEDWSQESCQMCEVYGNSFLNIAAAGAKDGSEGCFFEDDRERINKFSVETTINGIQQIYNCVHESMYRYCINGTPLASRSWALQERLLSPRTLHFSRAQLAWECNKKTACESLPTNLIVLNGALNIRKGFLSASWPSIVSTYSGSKLTLSRDKLVAMAGIIRKIAVERNDECVAGLWWRSIEIELLWHSRLKFPRPIVYQAPSWSWASVDGLVQIFPSVFTQIGLLAHVLQVHVQHRGDDSLGELCGGVLQILCRNLMYGIATQRGNKEDEEDNIFAEEVELGNVPGKNHISVYWDCRKERSDDLYLLPIRCMEGIRDTAEGLIHSIEGLVLIATRREKGQYQRVGNFSVWRLVNRGNEPVNEVFKVLSKPVSHLEEVAYVEYVEDDKYPNEHWVINII